MLNTCESSYEGEEQWPRNIVWESLGWSTITFGRNLVIGHNGSLTSEESDASVSEVPSLPVESPAGERVRSLAERVPAERLQPTLQIDRASVTPSRSRHRVATVDDDA